MSDSDSKDSSSNKTIDIAATLRRTRLERQAESQQIVEQAFQSFESDLKCSLNAAASTWSADLESLTDLEPMKLAFQNQRDKLTAQIQKETPRLLWLMKFPLLATAAVCLAMIGGTLLWWKIENRERVHMSPWSGQDGKQYMIVNEPSWNICEEQHSTDTKGKTTIILQRCRPVE